jgi:hypothetical protein
MSPTGQVQVEGGAFVDFEGNPLSFGTLVVELSHDENLASVPEQIVGGLKRTITLDVNGNIPSNPPTYLFVNSLIAPANSYYIVRGFSASGQQVYGPQYYTIPNTDPYNIGLIVPVNPPGAGLPLGGSATVTSVALTMPAEFSVSGSPITTSGTLAVTKANESANLVFAGPTSGAAAQPTFRSLVGADLPSFSGGAFVDYVDSGSSVLSVTANSILILPITIPFAITFSTMAWILNAQDGSNLYDFGIYNLSGTRQCHTGAIHETINGGGQSQFASVGSTTLSAGTYLWAHTGNATTANVFYSVGVTNTLLYFSTATTSSGGVLPSSITVATSVTTGTNNRPTFILY